MSETKTHAAGVALAKAGNRVGISSMVSSDTEAIVEITREKYPDATIDLRDCFYKVEREGSLGWNTGEVGERLGALSTAGLWYPTQASGCRRRLFLSAFAIDLSRSAGHPEESTEMAKGLVEFHEKTKSYDWDFTTERSAPSTRPNMRSRQKHATPSAC
jgi:hypothetical protein